MTPRSLAET